MPKSANTVDEYDFVDHEDSALSPEIVTQLREWLQPTDYLAESGEYRRHLLSQAPGTGLWICETEEYQKWHDSLDHGSLWIKGVPGAGKSVMAASLIQHLKVTENCPVLFFFFRNIVAANFSPRALIQDWLAQLLPHSPKLQFALQPRLATSLDETSDNDLIQLFLDGVSCVPKLYCVGDALDEMSADNRPFLEKLNSLATHRPRSLKLLMTGRPKQHLQRTLRDSSIVHVSLQKRLVDADILAYLKHRFDMWPKSESHRQLKQDVINMVAQKSEGLFLYAKLTMDQVEESLQSDMPLDINLTALEASLPVGLEQTYTSMLAKQRQETGITIDVQLMVLEAVIHARRPLRLNEVASLLECVYPNLTQPNAFKALIASSCGPLIEILEDETLQVIHHSFTEFLRGDTRSSLTPEATVFPIIYSLQAHRHMAMNCLRYLEGGSMLLETESYGAGTPDPNITFIPPQHTVDPLESQRGAHSLDSIGQRDPFDYRNARLLHPFLGYAVENWTYHASFYDEADDMFFEAIDKFLSPRSLSFLRWLVIQWGTTSTKKGSPDGIPTRLHLAAFAGLSDFASKILREGASVSARDARERTPLHWAAANGHPKVVALLIQYGADPDPDDAQGLKPIHLATLRNQSAIVKLLLETGVKPDTVKTKEDDPRLYRWVSDKTKGDCSIIYASRAGHVDTVLALAPFCDRPTLEKMLCLLCAWNRSDAALSLLNNSQVSADATYRNATALYYSCKAPNAKCAEALINRGADVHKLCRWRPRCYGDGESQYTIDKAPIHRLVLEWKDSNDSECRMILKLLLRAGADVDQLNGDGRTSLLEAAAYSKERRNRSDRCHPSVKALIEAGADIEAVDPPLNSLMEEQLGYNSGSVLHRVARHSRDLEMIKFLVEQGCNLEERNGSGETVLLCAMNSKMRNTRFECESKTRSIVQYLLEKGANTSCQDDEGNYPLAYAMSLGPSIFKLLFAQCQDMTRKKHCWLSLYRLRRKATDKFVHCLDMFLAEGFDIETRDEKGRTLYLLCCIQRHWERARILQSRGANINAKTDEGSNALLLSCHNASGNCEALKQLVVDGTNAFETDNDGCNVLHIIAKSYDEDKHVAGFVRWLVDLGVPVNAINNQGSTPSHLFQEQDTLCYGILQPSHHFVDILNSGGSVNLEILDNDGLSPLHLAAMRSEVEAAKLVSLGADVTLRTTDSQNALHLACRARQTNIVLQLLKRGVNFDEQDDFGRTPLHYACSSGEAESVAWLLKYGASTHLKASDGSTVLHACADAGTEQALWNIKGQTSQWLRSPLPDKLRPGDYVDRPDGPWPWYHCKYNPPQMSIRRQLPPAMARIILSLISAGVDISCCNTSSMTALDVALCTGCTGFAEVFHRSEEFFEEATKKLKDDHLLSDMVEISRQRIKLQMSLMLPRPYLDLLPEGDPNLEALIENPGASLGLLSTSETSMLINKGFEATPFSGPIYKLLEPLLQSGPSQRIDHLEIIKNTPRIISYYSSFESVKARLQTAWFELRFSDHTVMTALGIACSQAESNFLTLEMLVEKLHVDVNARFACCVGDAVNQEPKVLMGGTALHVLAVASHYWQLEALSYLLEHGAHVNAIDEKGETPLHVASVGLKHLTTPPQGLWSLEAVRILLSHGADINALSNEGMSALHKASSAPDILKELLNHGADAVIGAKSPLFMCIHDGSLQSLELLLDNGLSPDVVDEESHSRDVDMALHIPRKVCPLLFASFAHKDPRGFDKDLTATIPLLKNLIHRGADIYFPLNDDETLIHFLFEYPEYEVIEALMEDPCVSRIDFNRRDQHGRTVLMAACNWRRALLDYPLKCGWPPQLTKKRPPLEILSFKADATLVDLSGKTALHYLMSNPGLPDEILIDFINRKEVAPVLLQKDGEGYSPLHHALETLRPSVCQALLEKGADILEADPRGRTALHYIAAQCLLQDRVQEDKWRWYYDLADDFFNGCTSLWQKYLDQGGSINVTDDSGDTPLHVYVSMVDPQREHEELEACHVGHFQALFPEDSGVDVFAVNNAGETALHKIASRPHSGMLVEGHDKALFVMMMERGLDPLKEDAKGRSALDVASACDKHDIVGLLGRK